MKAVEAAGLKKYYGKARGITDVSLAVEEGDFFGFIGSNGAGKSTTIRILMGLIKADGGSAEIFGRDIQACGVSVLEEVGYLPSETMFYSGMRVRDVIRLSARLRKKDCRKEAERLCSRLELDTSRRVEELSLGNRKKAGIVCAMQHRPRLYVLDEPASGLDPLMQREFYSLLKERNEEGAAVFLSSHNLSEVQRYCRHAAVIREGKILASGSVEKLGRTGAKRVTLSGVEKAPALDHIRDVQAANGAVSFLYSGEPGLLLKTLSALPVTDITIAEPDLEEIFMHYYAEEEKSDGNFQA